MGLQRILRAMINLTNKTKTWWLLKITRQRVFTNVTYDSYYYMMVEEQTLDFAWLKQKKFCILGLLLEIL